MNNVASLFAREIKFKTLLEANEISAPVQRHLSRTYAALAFSIACAAVGSWVHLQTHAGGVLTSIAALGLVMGLATTSRSGKTDSPQRLAMFAGFGLLKGLSIGGLVEEIIDIDPAILVTAFLGTVFIFGSFSVAALLSKRRSFLYLGGLLSSAISMMMLFSFASLFFRANIAFLFNLYVGLLVFVGYIVYDTQLIIELAANGETDFLWHAVQLFIDVVGVFVRLAIILAKNAKESNNRRRK